MTVTVTCEDVTVVGPPLPAGDGEEADGEEADGEEGEGEGEEGEGEVEAGLVATGGCVTMTIGAEARSCVGPPDAACQAVKVAGPVEPSRAGPYVKLTGAPTLRLPAAAATGPVDVQPFGTVTPTIPPAPSPQLPAV